MQIFHFCCGKDCRGIRTDGITEGAIPTVRKAEEHTKQKYNYVLIKGWQWLTLDGDHDRQSWATKILIKENRTEYRLTIEIPEKEMDSLYDRDRLLELYPEVGPLFDEWEGSENWRVFRGNIPKYWIRKIERYTGSEWEQIPWR